MVKLSIDGKSKKMGNLHHLEDWLMKSPFKKAIFYFLEWPYFNYLLRYASVEFHEKIILEIGCGAGYAMDFIINKFPIKKYIAIDINPSMISLSKARMKYNPSSVEFILGDIRFLNLPSSSVDIGLAFTVLHHVINWTRGLQEMSRIIKPDGFLLINEIQYRSLKWFEWFLKVKHPKKAMFNWALLENKLHQSHFRIIKKVHFLWDFGFYLCQNNKDPHI